MQQGVMGNAAGDRRAPTSRRSAPASGARAAGSAAGARGRSRPRREKFRSNSSTADVVKLVDTLS